MVVEDGTGLPNSDSYATVAFADEYFKARGNHDWCNIDVDKKETLLIQGSDYIDLRWGNQLAYCRVDEAQAMAFPRAAVPADYEIAPLPRNLQRAAVEYALRAASGPLAPDLFSDESGYSVQRRKEKVGPIEEEVEFATGQNGSRQIQNAWKVYPAADFLMVPFLRVNAGRVIRN